MKREKMKKLYWPLVGVVGVALILLAYLSGSQWGLGAQIAAMIYGVLVTVFLLGQLAAFLGVQVNYIKNVEEAKFKVLEVEGLVECKTENQKSS